jgi:hypothetical protein
MGPRIHKKIERMEISVSRISMMTWKRAKKRLPIEEMRLRSATR